MEIKEFTYFFPEKPAGPIHIDQGLFASLSANPAWIAEPKYNGSRLELHRLPSGNWEFWNRHGAKFNFAPNPDLTKALGEMPLLPNTYYLFDGELRHNKTKGVRQKIVLYDVFVCANKLLTGVTFKDRREILTALMHPRWQRLNGGWLAFRRDDCLRVAPQYSCDFKQIFDELTKNPEIEGLVIKKLDGRLNLGRTRPVNSNWMFKVRRPNNSYHF